MIEMETSKKVDVAAVLGLLPSIDELLGTETAISIISELGRNQTLALARRVTESIRNEIREDHSPLFSEQPKLTRDVLLQELVKRLDGACQTARNSHLRRVINATGVVIHTNLGRAPLSEKARQAMLEASGYCTIEYDAESGKRGKRCSNAERLLADLTGAESALIVNNCAAAALLVLSVFARGFEVLVSRGELVEIGGDFRIPDVLTQSGAVLKEVGTTNRTKLLDFEKAISERSALILRVHPSNYRIIGFTNKPSIADLADLAHARGLLLYEDAGSGALFDFKEFGLNDEPVISQSLLAGADIVTFSGDKLLGGPQAGLIVGRKELVDKLRKHPLYRAIRVDKIICSALEATLAAYARDTAKDEVPVLNMLSMSAENINDRARSFKAKLESDPDERREMKIEIISGNSAVGGGAAPDSSPETALISLTHERHSDAQLERLLRLSKPPVITRIMDERVLIDLRTVTENEEVELIDVLRSIN